MPNILRRLKSLRGIFAGFSSLIPGYSFFVEFAPPLFPQISFITSALCMAALYVVVNYNIKSSVKRSIKIMVISFILICSYVFLIIYTTYYDSSNDKRYQIGFSTNYWSLSERFQNVVDAKLCPNDSSVSGLLKCTDGSIQDRINRIWSQFSIIITGFLSILVFAISSISWVYAWGLLVNSKQE